MKKATMYGLLLMTLLAVFTNSYAQKKTMATPEEQAQKMTDWMKTNLKLNDNQVSQVQSINLKYANKMHDVQASTQTKQQKMETLKADASAKDAEMKGVLTADQYKTYEAKKMQMKKQAKEKMAAKKATT